VTALFAQAPSLPRYMDDLTGRLVKHHLRCLEGLAGDSLKFIESARAEEVFITPSLRIEQTIHASDYIDDQIKQHASTNRFEARVFDLWTLLEQFFEEHDELWEQFRWIGFDTYYFDRNCFYAEKFQQVPIDSIYAWSRMPYLTGEGDNESRGKNRKLEALKDFDSLFQEAFGWLMDDFAFEFSDTRRIDSWFGDTPRGAMALLEAPFRSNPDFVKLLLSMPVDRIAGVGPAGFRVTDFEDGFHKRTKGQDTIRFHRYRETQPFNGLRVSKSYKKNDLGIRELLFHGVALGPRIGLEQTFELANFTHGLTRARNLRSSREWRADKEISALESFGFGIFGEKPEYIEMDLFGVSIGRIESKYWSAYSDEKVESFLQRTLSQENILIGWEYESDLPHYSGRLQDLQKETFRAIRDTPSWLNFLEEEFYSVQGLFQPYKQINGFLDCANLLFLFNPVFVEIWRDYFEMYYQGFYSGGSLPFVTPTIELEEVQTTKGVGASTQLDLDW